MQTFSQPHPVRGVTATSMVLLQSESTAEVRAALLAATVLGMQTQRISLQDLELDFGKRAALAHYTGPMLPVGSVEFVRAAMGVRGLPEPAPMDYDGVKDFLHREIRQGTVGELRQLEAPVFIKPVTTKTFSGFVYDPSPAPTAAKRTYPSPYVLEQLATVARLGDTTPIWISEPVEFVSEWRYYVDATGRILARARYDADGDDDAPEPTREVVQSAINLTVARLVAQGDAHNFAIDMGVTAGGRTACVEINDAWGLGLYAHARTPAGAAWKAQDYLEFLQQRWGTIVALSRLRGQPKPAAADDEGDDDEDDGPAATSSRTRVGHKRSNAKNESFSPRP